MIVVDAPVVHTALVSDGLVSDGLAGAARTFSAASNSSEGPRLLSGPVMSLLREADRQGAGNERGGDPYLQTLVENTRAVRFFERMGFEKHGPTPLVPGLRYRSRRLHQQTMVRRSQPS